MIWTHNRSVTRETGDFQTCFSDNRSVDRTVFPSKYESEEYDHGVGIDENTTLLSDTL